MADGDGGGSSQKQNDEAVRALFAGVNARSSALHPQREATQVARSRWPRHPVSVDSKVGRTPMRAVPAADFDRITARKTIGVPSIGLAPPRKGEPIPADQIVLVKRQMTGQPVNNRSNTLQNVDLGHLPARSIPVIQYDGMSDDTDMVVVTLGIQTHTPQLAGQVGFDSSFVADLLWGNGNASYRAQVDWGNGTMLCLAANFLAVNLLIPDNSSLAAGSTPTYDLSAGVAYGSAPTHNNRVRLTQKTTPLTAIHGSGNTPFVRIPPFAESFSISVSQTTGGSFPLLFPGPIDIQVTDTAAGAGPVIFTNYRYSASTNLAWQESNTFPILNGARFIIFTNTDAANDALIKVHFDIVL
jgi:hypothetical protein